MSKTSVRPRKKPTQNRSKEKVRHILDATIRLLETSGIESVSALNVAKEANVNVASFYQYFPNRDAVIYVIFQQWLDWVMTSFAHVENTYYLESPWPEFFSRLGDEIFKGEFISEKAAVELLRAMEIFPKLKEMNEKHGKEVADRLAVYLKGYNSPWEKAELTDLALCLFYSSNSLFRNAAEQPAPQKDLFMLWGSEMLMALISKCLKVKS